MAGFRLKKRSLALLLASVVVGQAACGARNIGVKVKGGVTPISVTWDVAFMGQFEPEEKDRLSSMLNEDIPQEVRDELNRALGRTAVAKLESYKDLLRGLSSQNERVLLDAIFKAGEFFFPKEMEDEKRKVVDVLITYLKASDNYRVRSHALLSLTKMGVPAIYEAHQMLRSKHNVERFVAAHHLRVLGTEDSLPYLERALQLERQPTVRRAIKKAIEEITERSTALQLLPKEPRGH